MDFVKRLATTTEQLLEHADATAAAQVKDLRQGGHVMRAAADRLEKTQLTTDDPVQLRAELNAAGEVLRHAQELAAEREQKLEKQLQRERAHHASEIDSLVGKIRALELHEKNLYAAQEQIKNLKEQLEKAAPQTLDVMELELARKEAEDARAALNASARESSARCSELERANLELSKELRRLTTQQESMMASLPSSHHHHHEPSETLMEITRKEYEERLANLDERRLATENALQRESERCATLEIELNRALALANELRSSAASERAQKELEIQNYKRESDNVRLQMENLKKTTEANGQKVLEQRLEALSGHLEMKQRTIDSLRSDKTALEARLNQLVSVAANVSGSSNNNNSVNGSSNSTILHDNHHHHSTHLHTFIERGADANRRPISRLPFFVNKPELAKVVDAFDGFTLGLGVLLRAKPMFRLFAIGYALLVHFIVLSCLLSGMMLRSSNSNNNNNGGGGSGGVLRGSSNNIS
jgi:hypothetical protein